jgi:exopolysaccharide biosynthesis polyprenyl glycosylphosphotransferase
MVGKARSDIFGPERSSVAAGPTVDEQSAVALPALRLGEDEARRAGSGAVHLGRGWLVRRLLLAADVAGLMVAFVVTEFLFLGNPLIDRFGIGLELAIFVATLPAWILGAKFFGLYEGDDRDVNHSTVDEFASIFQLVTVVVWLFFAASWVTGLVNPSQAKLSVFWLLAIAGMTITRSAVRGYARRQPWYRQNAVIVGAGEIGQLVGRKLHQHPEYGIELVGFVDADPGEPRRDLGDVRLLGDLPQLADIVRREHVDRVIFAFSREGHEEVLASLRSLREQSVHIDVVPRLFEAVSPNVRVHTVEGLPLVAMSEGRVSRSSRFLKRCVDVIGASIILAITAPALVVIAALIRRDSPGPALFRQTRLGKDAREFTLLKFRTMRTGAEEAPHRDYVSRVMTPAAVPSANNLYKLERPDDVTRVGRWLRKTSLDELPQLLNVLRGDMSLVGPRPCIAYELEFFSPHHHERFLVPAGLTGLWQVKARAHSTFYEALELDVAYVRGWSFGLDLRLLVQTPLLIFRKGETG